jgi:hypothetical protein
MDSWVHCYRVGVMLSDLTSWVAALLFFFYSYELRLDKANYRALYTE